MHLLLCATHNRIQNVQGRSQTVCELNSFNFSLVLLLSCVPIILAHLSKVHHLFSELTASHFSSATPCPSKHVVLSYLFDGPDDTSWYCSFVRASAHNKSHFTWRISIHTSLGLHYTVMHSPHPHLRCNGWPGHSIDKIWDRQSNASQRVNIVQHIKPSK